MATIVSCLESIGQAVVRIQAKSFELMIDNNYSKNIMMRDKSDLCSLAAILDWKIVAIKTLVIATGLPT